MSEQLVQQPVEIERQTTLEDAFKMIGLSCVTQLESNAKILMKNYDVESLHQMRVGLRRFYALLAFYSHVLQLPAMLKSELEWLSKQLSATRDWDVLRYVTLPMVNKKITNSNDLSTVIHIANSEAEIKHRQLIAKMRSQRFRVLMSNLKSFLFTSGWCAGKSSNDQARRSVKLYKIASASLERQREVLINRGKEIKNKRQKKIHRIRVATKQLRYESEFLRSLYSAKKVSGYIKKLARLQAGLGFLHDVAVANRLLSKMKNTTCSLQKEKKRIELLLKAKTKIKRQKVHKLWRDFTSATPFWAHTT